jgi:CHAT domain
VEYLDFEIEIGQGEGRFFPVEVIRSPAGERRGRMRFPFTELELENNLLKLQNALLSGQAGTRRGSSGPLEAPIERFGGELYEALFNDDIQTCFELSRREAQIQGKGLRLKLRLTDPQLAVLPWEFLFDKDQGEFVALSSNTPIVRTIDLPRVVQPLRIAPPLKVLGMVASPDDQAPLNVEREKQRVERAIEPLRERGAVEITWLETGTWQELQRMMRKGPWHVFHFVGHGRYDTNLEEGTLALVGKTGETDTLTATQMGRLLADHASLRLVLLNACEGAKGGAHDVFSGTAATLIRRGLPAVVAMQYEITDRAAIAFAQTFYESVAEGLPLDASVAEARKAVSFSTTSTVEWGTPVLFMQSSDGVLFVLDGAEPAPVTVPPPAKSASLTLGSSIYTRQTAAKPVESAPKSAASSATPTGAKPAVNNSTWNQQPAASRPLAANPTPAGGAPAPTTTGATASAATPAPKAPAPGEGYVFSGADGQLFVAADSVSISRRGPGGAMIRSGERVIPILDVTDVHFLAAPSRGKGFIQICYRGGSQVKTSSWQAGNNPDTVQFTELQQEWFNSAKQWIDYYVALAHSKAGSTPT